MGERKAERIAESKSGTRCEVAPILAMELGERNRRAEDRLALQDMLSKRLAPR